MFMVERATGNCPRFETCSRCGNQDRNGTRYYHLRSYAAPPLAADDQLPKLLQGSSSLNAAGGVSKSSAWEELRCSFPRCDHGGFTFWQLSFLSQVLQLWNSSHKFTDRLDIPPTNRIYKPSFGDCLWGVDPTYRVFSGVLKLDPYISYDHLNILGFFVSRSNHKGNMLHPLGTLADEGLTLGGWRGEKAY